MQTPTWAAICFRGFGFSVLDSYSKMVHNTRGKRTLVLEAILWILQKKEEFQSHLEPSSGMMHCFKFWVVHAKNGSIMDMLHDAVTSLLCPCSIQMHTIMLLLLKERDKNWIKKAINLQWAHSSCILYTVFQQRTKSLNLKEESGCLFPCQVCI